MLKTFVIWAVLAITTEDAEKIPVALTSPDRPFLSQEECQLAAEHVVEKLTVDLNKFGVENFGIMATCVEEVHTLGGLKTSYL